jgi:hypothetical protein
VRAPFAPAHRGGSGPALERRHDVLALTLPGHAGGPPLHGDVPVEAAELILGWTAG